MDERPKVTDITIKQSEKAYIQPIQMQQRKR